MAITVNDKDLGMVTAYAYALSKGYTGTEEEFAELMASYATVAQEAAQSASNAALSASGAADSAAAAAGSATDAGNSASAAEGSASDAAQSKTDAAGSAQNAHASADAAAGSASAASGSATDAGNSASAAEGSASDAAQSKTDAAGSATAAAGSAAEAKAFAHAVSYEQQTLTDGQKAQARTNIGAGSTQELDELKSAFGEITDEIHSTNIIPRDNVSGYINSNGNFVENVNPYYHTHKIRFSTDKTNLLIKWKYNNSNAFGFARSVAFYGNDGTTLKQYYNNAGDVKTACFPVPNDAAYFATDFPQNGYPFGYFSNDTEIDTTLYDEYREDIVLNPESLMNDFISFTTAQSLTAEQKQIAKENIGLGETESVIALENEQTPYATPNVSATATRTGYTFGLIKNNEGVARSLLVVFNSVTNCNRLGTIIGSSPDNYTFYILNYKGIKYTYVDITAEDTWVVLIARNAGEMSANAIAYDCSGMPQNIETLLHFTQKYNLAPSDLLSQLKSYNQGKWYGKRVLCIGDSLTHAGVWQTKLNALLGMNVYTHALGGAGMMKLIDGGTTSVGTIEALSTSDVSGKDLIIFYAGYNDRGIADGEVGDVYPTNNTIAGRLQYCINAIYNLLSQAGNLTCRLIIVTPHCAGKYQSIPVDGYSEYPAGSGRTMRTLADIMQLVAQENSLPCYNAWENSGINKFTWNAFSASPVAEVEGVVQDQLHLNTYNGYPHLGNCIASFVAYN